MDLLREAIDDRHFLLDVSATNFDGIAQQAIEHAADSGIIAKAEVPEILELFIDRERKFPSAIGDSVAVPHLYDDRFKKQTIVFVRLDRALNLSAPDRVPTRFFWFLCGPMSAAGAHLDVLAEIARITSDDEFRYDIGLAHDQNELLEAFDRVLERTASRYQPPKPPAKKPRITFQPFRGLRDDLKRRLPHYKSDFIDGLNLKGLSSILFLFFACLAPAITFGAIYAAETENHLGVIELIVATIFCGVIYALLAGQPLIILGGTGPLLIFTIVLYQYCDAHNIPFLEARAWVGVWCTLIVVVMAILNTSNLISWFTRFTDEIFAGLISLIFILKAVQHLLAGLEEGLHAFEVGSVASGELAVGLLGVLLALGTFYIAMSLRRIRHSRFLSPTMREFLADFGPSIAVFVMAIVAIKFFHSVPFERLQVSEQVEPSLISDETGEPRPWLLDLFKVDTWVIFVSIIPAIFLSMLLYADQNITARLVNSRDHHLKKGSAYHWDLGLVGVLLGICSIFGLPWLVAATVRSLNHVRSLATLENVVNASGQSRERVIHVHETRVTGLVIHLLIALPLFFVGLLHLIPTSVLYGLFLFMGVVSLYGNQFMSRLTLWFTERSLYPPTHYVRKVPRRVIHVFTLIQLSCLALLWIIKESAFGLFFPLFIILLVPFRVFMSRLFKPEHLSALDAEEEPAEEEDHWS